MRNDIKVPTNLRFQDKTVMYVFMRMHLFYGKWSVKE